MENKIEVVSPHGMFGPSESDSILDVVLREIAEVAGDPKDWPEKYGSNFENDVFIMHRFCWCEKEECPYCWDEEKHGKQHPNFMHKPTGFKVWWYKYIGRGVEISEQLSVEQLKIIKTECIQSIKAMRETWEANK